MSRWRDLVPAPLAAPETPDLRAARIRTIIGLCCLAAIMLFFGELRAAGGPIALASLAAAATFVAVQGWQWISAKNAADNAWLMRGDNDAS
jgi:hypothetical protein